MGRITWVCTTCAEHFTRAYGANRHNNNLHEGKGTVVRLLDYIVGRINGQFLPKDPLAYRHKKGKHNKNLLSGSNPNNGNNNGGYKVIADSMSDILSHENIISKLPKPRLKANSTYHHSNDKYDSDNANERPYHSNRISEPSSKVDDNDNNKLSSYTHKLVERRSKLEEFKILVNKYYPPQNASRALAVMSTYIYIQKEDDDFLDKLLTSLRNIGKGELCHENVFDKLVDNNRENTAKPYSHLSDFSSLQPMLDKKVDRSSQDKRMQAKAKLTEIGQILSPVYPLQFVQNVITELTNRYNATGDISILDTALENHRPPL
jgi:hypothetical protein